LAAGAAGAPAAASTPIATERRRLGSSKVSNQQRREYAPGQRRLAQEGEADMVGRGTV